MKGGKKLVYDFKVSLARLWHGTLQRERKITLHTWSIKKSLWNGLLGGIQSGTSHGIDGTAPGRRDTWPGQDGCWAGISGHWPILWELLSHAVWRRTDGVGSTYGHATGFISVKNSPDVIAFSQKHSSISEADRDDWASQERDEPTCKLTSNEKVFLLFHLHSFFSFTPYIHSRCSNLIANHHFLKIFHFVLRWQFVPANWKFCIGLPCTKHRPITNATDMISLDSAGLHCFSRQDRTLTAATVFSNS